MDLVHCLVCGEPIYTFHVGQALAEKTDKPMEALCPLHKRTVSLDVWKRVASGRNLASETGI